MRIYAGIDEAGYGPMFGPLVVGRSVFAVDGEGAEACPPMWKLLGKAVCRQVGRAKGRIAVNDSKKLKTAASGVKHLEMGVLSFAGIAKLAASPAHVGELLDLLGETCHREVELPWYHVTDDRPWAPLPGEHTSGELAVARSMLGRVAGRAGVAMMDLGAAVVFEDRFNRMVSATRSKASASFTFVARHLDAIWRKFGGLHPMVIVDRQSGRTHYRELLATAFSGAEIAVLDEDGDASSYRLSEHGADGSVTRSMTIRFEVNADGGHMPVALASMVSKYVRELLMARFQQWFMERAPAVKPTAGYATDAKRFWREIQPTIKTLAIDPQRLRRMC